MVTLGLDLQQTGNLHRRSQEDCVKHFFPRVLGKLPSFGQSAHQIRKAKHLVELSLEPMPASAQMGRSSFSLSFSLRNRFRFTLQMVAAPPSTPRPISTSPRTLSPHSAPTRSVFAS